MTERIFIEKRQRKRKGEVFSWRNIIRLMVVSPLVLGGFLYFIGDPSDTLCEGGCEAKYSLASQILGFFIMFLAVIAVAAIVGVLFSRIRASRGSSFYDADIEDERQ